jgi:hypothetical protein
MTYNMKSLFRHIISLLPLIGGGWVGVSSCDSYIDITPKGAVTIDSARQYYELIVNPMRSYYPSSFAFLTDELWAKESNIIGYENLSANGINFTFNEQADRTLFGDNNLYENMYAYILRSNLIINNIDAAEGTQDIKTLAKAEARVFRAWDHFLAVNTFAKAYDPATAKTDGGVCIVTASDLEQTPAKATVDEVYNFIIAELEDAVPQLQAKPQNIYHPNRAYGYGLLAQVYLHHRDWQKARDAAEKSLALNDALVDYNEINAYRRGILDKNYGDKYGDDRNPEVLSYMWIGSGWNNEQAILYTYGIISPELIALYEEEKKDLRYTLFFMESGQPTTWFDTGSGADMWIPTVQNSKFMYATVGMRTPEVYLIQAEAEARLNNIGKAVQLLNTLRAKRIAGGNTDIATPSSQTEMVKLIIKERRKELLFGFHRFFDLKRLNIEPEYQKTVTHVFPVVNISAAYPQQTYTLQPNSRMYIIPFPHSARDKNPNLTLNTDERN